MHFSNGVWKRLQLGGERCSSIFHGLHTQLDDILMILFSVSGGVCS